MAHTPCQTPEPVLLLECGFQELTWICLTPITQKGSSWSFFLSSQLPVDFKFQQLRAHVAMPTPPLQASRQKWAGPISGLPGDVTTF